MPTKFFIHKTSWNKNFLKNSRIPLRKFSAVWDIKISTENRDMPPLIHSSFSVPELFRKTEGFLYKAFRFGAVRQKVPTKPWCPPPLLCMKNFDERIFLKQHQSVFQWNVSVQWDKDFDGKSWYSPSPPPPVIQIFSVPEINETLKDPPTKIFRHCETKKFRRKIVIPLLCIKFFDTPNFLKHWKDAHEIFLHCETKNFRRKIVIPPNMHKLFRYPKFSEIFKGCPRNFSALWDKKFSTKSCDTPYYA